MASQFPPMIRMCNHFSDRFAAMSSMLTLWNHAQAVEAGAIEGMDKLTVDQLRAHRGTQEARMKKIAEMLRGLADTADVIAGIHAGDDAHPEQ